MSQDPERGGDSSPPGPRPGSTPQVWGSRSRPETAGSRRKVRPTMKRQKLTRRLFAEQLETREVPATFGVPWPDAQHLTVSFAPDNTSANGSPNALFQTLNAHAPTTSAWQAEILRALQTWAVQANINIGIVSDGGQAIGTSGSLQSDTRFGDIRVAAVPEGPTVLAITPPVDILAGT